MALAAASPDGSLQIGGGTTAPAQPALVGCCAVRAFRTVNARSSNGVDEIVATVAVGSPRGFKESGCEPKPRPVGGSGLSELALAHGQGRSPGPGRPMKAHSEPEGGSARLTKSAGGSRRRWSP